MDIIEILTRTLAIFVVLLLLTRLMGRKQVSQLTFFNYITGISIGTVAGSITVNPTLNFGEGITALIGWALLTVLAGLLDIKSKKARDIIDGQPIIIIKDGKVMEDALKRLRLDIDELNMLLRNRSIFSIKDVDYAVLETNGKLSVLKKEAQQNATKQDVDKTNQTMNVYSIPTQVVLDGHVMDQNLTALNLDYDWLNNQLQAQGVQDLNEVFYAEVQKDGTLYIDEQNDYK